VEDLEEEEERRPVLPLREKRERILPMDGWRMDRGLLWFVCCGLDDLLVARLVELDVEVGF
jgi:hypothetical protein